MSKWGFYYMGHLSFPLGFQFMHPRAELTDFLPWMSVSCCASCTKVRGQGWQGCATGQLSSFPHSRWLPWASAIPADSRHRASWWLFRQTGSSHLCSLPGRICEVTIFSTCVCCSTAFSHSHSHLVEICWLFSITSVLPALSLLWFYTLSFPIYYHVMRKFFKVSVS